MGCGKSDEPDNVQGYIDFVKSGVIYDYNWFNPPPTSEALSPQYGTDYRVSWSKNFQNEDHVSWQTKTEKLSGIGTEEKGTFQRSSPQQNLKGKESGDHYYYDPRNHRSGYAGGNRDKDP